MRTRFLFDNVAFFANAIEVRIGEVFDVEIFGAPGNLQWQATNDAVLNIAEAANGLSAHIEATAVGTSRIELEYRDHDYGPLMITVVDRDAAKQLKATHGAPEQQ